ncbi:MAG: hypothetical protein IPI60_10345 [Saprospiraceae bacterium]|nr:hypothetical protein [Saprospiraceae bacterium]
MYLILTLELLAGSWYIHYTNFPMWLKGDKLQPTFNYSISDENGKQGLTDIVRYQKNGKSKEIAGFDTPLNAENTQFKWRGKGLLWLFSSRWEVKYYDEKLDWALIYFSRTIATPEGYDIITRKPELTPAQESAIKGILKELGKEGLLTQLSK